MLRELFARFFRRRRPASEPEPVRLAYQVQGVLPPGPLPPGMAACVLCRGELVAVSHEDAPRMQDGEVCWLLPADDLPMPVVLQRGESPLAIEVTVRFETDPTIATLLRDRTALTHEELAALLTSELAGLADMLGHADATALTELGNDSRERLRAKLSLILQAKGLRCTGLGTFQPAPAATVAEPDAEAAEPDLAAADLQPVLAEAIGAVGDDDQWDELVTQLEAGGMTLDEAAADELDAVGAAVVDRQMDAAQAAQRVSQLAAAARSQAGIASPDLRRWQGLALRLRLLDAAAETDDGGNVERNSFRFEPEPRSGERNEFRSTPRPWTWWMLRRSSVDTRLRQFLQDAVRQTRAALDEYRGRLTQIGTAARVKELSDRLRLVEDLLATVPTLAARPRQYRLDRDQVSQAVQSIERAVTAAELAQAAIHALSARSEDSADWQAALAEATTAVSALEVQLRGRRQVR
jgi:uncharacterized protein YgfB (UPF0149 family)